MRSKLTERARRVNVSCLAAPCHSGLASATLLAEFDPAPNFLMYYVYVLKNTCSQEVYYGYTNNVQRRCKEHNKEGFWELVYYEAYRVESDARERERKLKHYGHTRTRLKNRLKGYLNTEN